MATAGSINLKVKIDIGSANKDLKKMIAVIDQLGKDGKTDLKSLGKAFDGLEKEINQTAQAQKKMQSGSKAEKGGWKSLGAAVGGYAMAIQGAIRGIKTVVTGVQTFIKEADNHDMANGKLIQGLQNVNDYSKENIKLLNEQSTALSRLTGIQADEITHGQGVLTTFGQTSDQISVLTPRILDMAASMKKAGKDMDVQQVALAMGKAITGGAGALGRYGVVMTDVQKEQFKMTQGMEKTQLLAEILDANFKGMGESTATTTEKMSVEWNNFQVAVGGVLKDFQGDIAGNILPILKKATTFFTEHKDEIVSTVKIMYSTVKMLFRLMLAPIIATINTMAELPATFIDAVNLTKTILSKLHDMFKDTFNSLNKILGSFAKALFYAMTGQWDKAKASFLDMGTALKEGFKDIGTGLADIVKESYDFNKTVAKNMVSAYKEAYIDPVKDMASDVKSAIEGNPIQPVIEPIIKPPVTEGTGGAGTTKTSPGLMGLDKTEPGGISMVTEEMDVKPKEISTDAITEAGRVADAMDSIFINLASSVGGALDTMTSGLIDGIVDGGLKLDEMFKNLMKDLAKMALMAGFKALFGVATGGAFTGFSALFGSRATGFAGGADFTVPPEFPADSMKIGVGRGEHVKITPAGESPSSGSGVSITNIMSGVFPTDRQTMAKYQSEFANQSRIDAQLYEKG